jgi:hypothetical protein
VNLISQQAVAGWLLILSFIIFVPSGILFTGRAIWKWTVAQTQSYLVWERSILMTAILSLTLGLVLLERLLEAAGDTVLPPSGMVIFLIGAVLVFVAETLFLSRHEWIYAQTVVFVILSFLAQGIFGISILRTGFLPGWIGWATVIWSLAWLIILPIARPRDIYYPWLHYVAPFLMGIALLVR